MTGVKQTFWRGYHRDIFGIIWQAKTELFKRAQVKILRRLGHTARKAPVLTSFLVITLLASLPYLSGLVPPAQASPTPTFTFAASGDIGSLTSTTGGNNLARLSSSGMGFFLGLGDLSYNSSLTGDVCVPSSRPNTAISRLFQEIMTLAGTIQPHLERLTAMKSTSATVR